MKRLYLDCAATFPSLYKKNYHFLNPSSLHFEGRQAQKFYFQTSEFLYNFFSLSPKDYDLIFHSGATEGLQSLYTPLKKFYTHTFAHKCLTLSPKAQFFDLKTKPKKIVDHFFFTPVPSELGIYLPWEEAKKYSKDLHADCAQLIGKYPSYKLPHFFTSFTFSAHKFGGSHLGWTFVKKNHFQPLFLGTQQKKLRGGTLDLNSLAQSLEGLKKFHEKFSWEKSLELKNKIIKILTNVFEEDIIFPFLGYTHSCPGILSFFFNNFSSEKLFMYFDQAGLSLSLGQACSLGEDQSLFLKSFNLKKPLLRLSPSPFLTQKDLLFFQKRLLEVKKRLI